MKPTVTILAAILVQFAAVGVLLFGRIGFDFPGSYGLDIRHGVLFVAVYVLSLLFGVTVCVVRKKRWLIAVQAVIPVLLLVFLVVPTPNPRLDAAQYQHLVGKSKDEVRTELRDFRVWTSGFYNGIYFESYNGMEIHYSTDDRVVKVAARD